MEQKMGKGKREVVKLFLKLFSFSMRVCLCTPLSCVYSLGVLATGNTNPVHSLHGLN